MSIKEERAPLLPIRHEKDFFVADIFDAIPKADQASMEHPIFSLSTKPDYRPKRYENGKNFIEIMPSSEGLATVHDRDLIIYSVSQLMAAKNMGRPISKTIHIKAYDLLVATNRPTSGQAYQNLKQSLIRLKGTQINTNIATNGREKFSTFGIIDRGEIIKETREGKMVEIQITLSDWLYEAVLGTEVLTISKDYFRLRKALERRVYDLARKHCGNQAQWKISLEALKNKTGSGSSIREFRRMINKIIKDNKSKDYFPDYIPIIEQQDHQEFVLFINRKTMSKSALSSEKQEVLLKMSSLGDLLDEVLEILTDAKFSSLEILELEKAYSSDIIENAVFAANKYIEKLTSESKPIKSRKSIIRKALSEAWKIEEISTQDKPENKTQELDQSYEDGITFLEWKKVRESLVIKLGIPTFNAWIKGLQYKHQTPDTAVLVAKSKFIRDRVENSYSHNLIHAWRQHNPQILNVIIDVEQ
jgi:plasmid replication initiation protein